MKHTYGILQREVGAMQRLSPLAAQAVAVKAAHLPPVGMGAYQRLPAQVRAQVDAVVKDAAEQYRCRPDELVWTIDRPSGAIRVKKREVIRI